MKEYIKDFYGRICGSVEEKSNGDVVAKDFYGRYLGKYIAKSNKTYDFYGRPIVTGNITTSLVRDAERERVERLKKLEQ